MPRSSISSSDGVRNPRRWKAWAAATVFLLVGSEALLRIPAIQDALPTRTHYHDVGIVVREDALRRTLRAHGRIDVLFVGSSIVRTNIQPQTFDRLIQSRTRESIVSFNAGLSGLWPEGVALYLENVWMHLAKPAVVVQGIRYPELAATTHALRADQVFSGSVEAAWRESSWRKRAYSAAAANLRLLQYRGTLTEVLQRYTNGRPGPASLTDRGFGIDPRGYTPRLPTLREARQRGLIREENFPPEVICPDACARGFAALRRAIVAARGKGAQYILVNIPEHGTRWRGEQALDRYREYLVRLRAFADSEGIVFMDPTEGNPYSFQNDDDYSDTYHMSPAGAERLTSMLAARLKVRARHTSGAHVIRPSHSAGDVAVFANDPRGHPDQGWSSQDLVDKR
jgi:hypothetical protein